LRFIPACCGLLFITLISIAPLQAQAITLTIASYPNFDAAIRAAIPRYEKLHPEINIRLVALSFYDHHHAMTTALATGAGLPDIMGLEQGFIGRFVNSDGLEVLSAAPYNALQYQHLFVPYTLVQAQNERGELFAMPADIGPGSLFYRSDLLAQAGISLNEMTKTWESFIHAGIKLKQKSIYLVANASDVKDIYIRIGLKPGEGIYFNQAGASLVRSERFVKAFTLAKQVRDQGLDARLQIWSNEWAESIRRGQIATQMMGAWFAGHLSSWIAPDSPGLWRVSQLPAHSYANWGGSFYAIPKAAAHKSEAWDFIRFMTLDPEMQLKAFEKLDAFPALLSAQQTPHMTESMSYFGQQQARLIWKDAAANMPIIATYKYDALAAEIIRKQMDLVLEDHKNITDALDDAERQIKHKVRR
jgi:multiple sugar transport system substrate-binding protein